MAKKLSNIRENSQKSEYSQLAEMTERQSKSQKTVKLPKRQFIAIIVTFCCNCSDILVRF